MRSIAGALLLAFCGVASADDAPASVKPFLTGDEETPFFATGAFGAKDTTVVVWWNIMGAGSYEGFAVVPDAKAKGGFKKVSLPKLLTGVTDGGVTKALVANLDKDADDELVLAMKVTRSQASQAGGFSYTTTQYVVLDGTGGKFKRDFASEKKLDKAMKTRLDKGDSDPLPEADVRKVLGVKK